MTHSITHIHIENFRCLENISMDLDLLNILFGPNGVGKTTFLDTIWYVRDCAIRGVDVLHRTAIMASEFYGRG